jgi:8-amino-7-oxononanoate synthase
MTADSLNRFAAQKLAQLTATSLHRELVPTRALTAGVVHRDDRELISFASNDYLGLCRHQETTAANLAATRAAGTGSGASRHVTGEHPLYGKLERALAAFKGTEDAVVFGSGYLANIGIVPALIGRDDLIVIDELCHSCLYAGATLARAKVVAFEHNDAGSAAALIDRHRADHPRCLILTEGVFSMDGDRAPLRDLLDIAARTDAWLMVDDAHGLGVVENGRGSVIDNGKPLPIALQMGTLSKAVGAYGGYLCTSRDVADLIRNRARSLIYTTALPPGILAAALKGIEIIASDAELVAKPFENARRFSALCALPPPQSAVVPILLETPERALEASRRLEQQGYLAVAIRPPTVPEGTARLRCAFSATHSPEQVEGFAAAMRHVLATL